MRGKMTDPKPTWPIPLPKVYWDWQAWRDKGGLPKDKPQSVADYVKSHYRIPSWFYDRYAVHGGTKLPPVPPPPQLQHPFKGIGAFVEHPESFEKLTRLIDYVVLREHEVDSASVAEAHWRGMKIYVWDEPPVNGPITIADGYVAVVEGPDQRKQAETWLNWNGTLAWCTNATVESWPNSRVSCLGEAYTSVDEHATADQTVRMFKGRGAPSVCPGVLLGEGGWSLEQYLPAINLALQEDAPGWWFFSAESASPADIETLRKLRGL